MKHQQAENSAKEKPSPAEGKPDKPQLAMDLEACPRCGEPIETILWGQSNCVRCGLHFECC